MVVAAHGSRSRGPLGLSRLLEHCEAARRGSGFDGDSARARLEHELGSALAARLVYALADGRRGRVPLPL